MNIRSGRRVRIDVEGIMKEMIVIVFCVIVFLVFRFLINKKKNRDYYERELEINQFIFKYVEELQKSQIFWNEAFPFDHKISFLDKYSELKVLIEKAFKINKYDEIYLEDMKNDIEVLKEEMKFWRENSNRIKAESIIESAKLFTNIVKYIENEYYDHDIYMRLKTHVDDNYKALLNQEKFLEINLPCLDFLFRKYHYIIDNRDKINEEYVRKEKERNAQMFNNIDGKSLDDQQRSAVVIDESNMLTVAGAGSGKTLTISAKVLYLTQVKNVSPDDILLLTFTKKAAKEMTDRISEKLGVGVVATTFHAHGFSTMKQMTGMAHINILEDGFKDKVILDYFTDEIKNEPDLLKKLVQFYSMYMNLPYIIGDDAKYLMDFAKTQNLKTNFPESERQKNLYSSHKEKVISCLNTIKSTYYKNDEISPSIVKAMDEVMRVLKEDYHDNSDYLNDNKELEILRDKISNIIASIDVLEHGLVMDETLHELAYELQEMVDILLKLRTHVNDSIHTLTALSGYEVKSYEELMIANFLFLQGIEYIYEQPYMYEVEKGSETQWAIMKPDFYLPEFDVYLEHFGINRDGRLPQYSKGEEKRYLDGVSKKRETHKKYNTTIVETYSYEVRDENFFETLLNKLEVVGVTSKPLSNGELFDLVLSEINHSQQFQEFIKLMTSFLNSVKGEDISDADIAKKHSEIAQEDRVSTIQRKLMFLELFRGLNRYYDQCKINENKIDFDDMINRSIDLILSQRNQDYNHLRYIIIDEYQDVSGSKVRYLQALKKVSNAKIFAVGDDWQSIYGFAGSDVGYFTNFSDSFGYTEQCFIETTYRNSQELIDVAGSFIMANKDQLKKNLKSPKRLNNPVIDYGYTSMKSDEIKKIRDKYYKDSIYELTLSDIRNSDKLADLAKYPVDLSRKIFVNALHNYARFSELNNSLVEILDDCVKDGAIDIKIIGRTRYSINSIKEGYLPNFSMKSSREGIRIRSNLENHKKLHISYITAHSSKGLEADATIILGVENRLTGFPNKMIDDEILRLFKNHQETFNYAEERRLFYVALTRTKGKCYVSYDKSNPSIFIDQIFGEEDSRGRVECPRCHVGHIVLRERNHGKFCGCSEYPRCQYLHSTVAILDSQLECPSCGGMMVRRKGKNGEFYGCSNFRYIGCLTSYNIKIENGVESLVPAKIPKELVINPISFVDTIQSTGKQEDIVLSVSDIQSIQLVASFYIDLRYWYLLDQEVLDSVNIDLVHERILYEPLSMSELIQKIDLKNRDILQYIDCYGDKKYEKKAKYENAYLTLVKLIQDEKPWKNNETGKDYRYIYVMGKKYLASNYWLNNYKKGGDGNIWNSIAS